MKCRNKWWWWWGHDYQIVKRLTDGVSPSHYRRSKNCCPHCEDKKLAGPPRYLRKCTKCDRLSADSVFPLGLP